MPRTARWTEERAAEIDPVGKIVVTDAGKRLPYDHLIVATGLDLNSAEIEGKEVSRIGQEGFGSIHAGPQQARATWRAMSAFADRGVGFDYAANAVGRFAGTLLSGLLYAVGGLAACLIAVAMMLLACWALTRAMLAGLAQSGSVDGYVWEVMADIAAPLINATRVISMSEPWVSRRCPSQNGAWCSAMPR